MREENLDANGQARPPESEGQIADRVPVEQAIHDLASDVTASKGWWWKVTPLARRRDNAGRWLITYTFDSTDFHRNNEATDYAPLSLVERRTVEGAMKEIERVSNIRFTESKHIDLINKSDIRFFGVRSIADPVWAGLAENSTDQRDVLLCRKTNYTDDALGVGGSRHGTIIHELLHALGLSHPGANGNDGLSGGTNPSYTMDSTIMSYNRGVLPQGLGPYDVLALQHFYGIPQPAARRDPIVNGDDLAKTTVLYSERGNPFSLDFRNSSLGAAHSTNLWIDLDTDDIKQQILAKIFDAPSVGFRIGVRLVPGTRIKDVFAGRGTRASLFLTGNELPNVLQGGDRDDVLRPRGGNDTLTGNGGNDRFVLNERGGTHNRITDFNPTEDKVAILGLRFAELRRTPDGRGTEVLATDATGTVITSAILTNGQTTLGPEQVRSAIEQGDQYNPGPNVRIIPNISVGNGDPTHPSGLPDRTIRGPSKTGHGR